jgi:N-acetylmuramic acid 6-phosphate (MurNAc-6-P) etherase
MREVRNQLYELSKIDVELADVWFQKSTSYIDALREIEIKASEHVKFVCEKQMQIYRSADNTKNVVSTPPGFDGSSPLKSVTTQQRDQILQLEIELEKARTALNDRKLIERAKSVLREKMGMSDEQAHRQLQKSAMEQNIPMVLVCQKILDTMDSLSK